MTQARKYWLMKSEPGSYSIDDLKRDKRGEWDGVRNYQARNFMRDDMKKGDGVLFYHSNSKPMGVAGIAEVCKEGYPDFTAWDGSTHHLDPKASPENPIWSMVDVKFVEKFPEIITLAQIKEDPACTGMLLIKKGMRLSVQPVEKKHYDRVCKLGRSK